MGYLLAELAQNGVPKLLDQIASREQWEDRRERIRHTWMDCIGGIPERRPVSCRILSEVREADHIRRHIVYDSVMGDKVTAFLLLPLEITSGTCMNKRFPAILALHPTADTGKMDIATALGRDNRRYGLELANRNYIVLAPDAISAGERVYEEAEPFQTAPFYQQHPTWSVVGKMIADHMQGIDLLCSLDDVDPERIGVIGHSLGGYNAFFLAGVDRRVKAIVSSCGFSTFAGDPTPDRWGIRDWFTHIPRISEDLQTGMVPFEFHEIAALAAPIPFLNWSGQSDHIFPHWKFIAEALQDIHELYKLLGAGDRFVSLLGSCGHDFPPHVRVLAYDFLDSWLKS
jgi:fermentation-respiration switch protein FrsA (DUF1100 family)